MGPNDLSVKRFLSLVNGVLEFSDFAVPGLF